jgi:hypothetical protein
LSEPLGEIPFGTFDLAKTPDDKISANKAVAKICFVFLSNISLPNLPDNAFSEASGKLNPVQYPKQLMANSALFATLVSGHNPAKAAIWTKSSFAAAIASRAKFLFPEPRTVR